MNRLALVGLLITVAVAACGDGNGTTTSICTAVDALRDTLGAVDAAKDADAANDGAAVERAMDEVDRLIRLARTRLAAAERDPGTAAAARTMIEASNYLEFMVGDYRATGRVDFSLRQFASRELNRAVGGAGGAPLNC